MAARRSWCIRKIRRRSSRLCVDEAAHSAPPGRSIVPLKNTIRVLDGFGKSLEVILPKLRDGYIVPESDVGARAGARESRRVLPLAVGRMLSQRDRDWRQTARRGPALHEARAARRACASWKNWSGRLRDEEMRVLTLGREIKELTSLLDRLEGEKREAEKQAMTSGHMLQQLDSEMTRVGERLNVSPARTAAAGGGAGRAGRHSAARDQSDIAVLRDATARWSSNSNRRGGRKRSPACAQRRDEAAQTSFAARWPGWRHWKSATVRRRRVLERIESLVAEMGERVYALRLADRSVGRREIAARERRTSSWPTSLIDLECRDAMPPKRAKGCCSLRSEQLRARLAEIDEAAAQQRASCSIRPATVAANCRRPRPSCNPTRSTWRKPA